MNRQGAPSPSLASPLWWAAAVGLALYAAVYLYHLRQGWQRELDAEIARIRAAGEPITVEDLYEFYSPSEKALAAGEEWLAAMEFTRTKAYRDATRKLPFLGRVDASPWLDGGALPELEASELFLDDYAANIERVVAVVREHELVSLPVKWGDPGSVGGGDLHLYSAAARLLELRAAVSFERGDLDSALNACFLLMKLAKSPGAEPNMVSLLVMCGIEGVAETVTSRLLSIDGWTEMQLAQLQAMFSNRTEQEYDWLVNRCVLADRAVAYHLTLNATKEPDAYRVFDVPGVASPAWRFAGPLMLATLLRHYSDSMAVFAAPLQTGGERHPALRQDVSDKASSSLMLRIQYGPAALLSPADRALFVATRIQLANSRAAAAGCAIARWRLAEDEWPKSLVRVTERFPELNVNDPFSEGDLVYRIESEGCLVYSFGQDLDDDGGRPYTNDPKKDCDLVFRIGPREPSQTSPN